MITKMEEEIRLNTERSIINIRDIDHITDIFRDLAARLTMLENRLRSVTRQNERALVLFEEGETIQNYPQLVAQLTTYSQQGNDRPIDR